MTATATAASCPHCQTAVPRAVVESTIAQVVHCAGCRSTMLFGNGRVLRALRAGGESGDGDPASEAGGGHDTGGSAAEAAAASERSGAPQPGRFSVSLSTVPEGSLPGMRVTPTAVTRRARSTGGTSASPAGAADDGVVTRPPLEVGADSPGPDAPVSAGPTAPPSSVAVTAPSMWPARSGADPSRFDSVRATDRRDPSGAITAPSVAAANAAPERQGVRPTTAGATRTMRVVAVAAAAVLGGGLVFARWGREATPVAPAPVVAPVRSASGPSSVPARPEGASPATAGTTGATLPGSPAAAGGGTTLGGSAPGPTPAVDPTIPEVAPTPPAMAAGVAAAPAQPPVEEGERPSAPVATSLSAPQAGAPAHLSPAQRKEMRRRSAWVARQQAKAKRAEKRRLAIEARRQKRIEKRQAALAKVKPASGTRSAATPAGKAVKAKRGAAHAKQPARRKKMRKRTTHALTLGRLVAGPLPTLGTVVHEGRKGAKARRGASRGKKGTQAGGGHLRRGGARRITPAPLPPAGSPVPAGVEAASSGPSASGQENMAEIQAAESLVMARARNACQQGHARLFEGDPVAAERHYRAAIVELPSYVAALRGLGMAMAQQGRATDAIEVWTNYCTQAPRAHDAWLIRRHIERLRKDPAALVNPAIVPPAPKAPPPPSAPHSSGAPTTPEAAPPSRPASPAPR